MDEYDSPWKEALEHYLPECLTFFFPQAAAGIDWSRGYEFLDKELQKIAPKAELGGRTVDKLVKVWRNTGQEVWVLIHLEVQSQYKKVFPERMYIYNYRSFDRYGRQVASFAILSDDRPGWRPDSYGYELWGCRVRLDFPTVKLLDYRERWEELENSRNPFAVVVTAHLHTQATRKDPEERFQLKLRLIRSLYERGYSKRDVQLLFRFIDWLMALPPELERQLEARIIEYEEESKMPYVTSIERLGMERGMQQGLQQGTRQGIRQGVQQGIRQGIIEVLQMRFERIPSSLVERVNAIGDTAVLTQLLRRSVTAKSPQEFEQMLAAQGEHMQH